MLERLTPEQEFERRKLILALDVLTKNIRSGIITVNEANLADRCVEIIKKLVK